MRHWGVCIALCIGAVASAQTVTPTPPPSKTPAPMATSVQEATATAPTDSDRPFTAFNQRDLTVLVGNVQRPNGLVWFNDKLYTACNGDWTLYEVDAVTGQTETFVFGVKNAHMLHAEATEDGFDLWIPDFDNNKLVRVDQTRSAPTDIVSSMDSPWGIAAWEDRFLVTSVRGNEIVQVTRDGQVESLVSELRSPAGIVVDGDYVYWANNGSARRAIEWLPAGELGSGAEPQPLVSGLQNASGLAMGSDGYLYLTFALGTRGVVGRVDPDECREGGCSNEQVEIVVYTELQAPLAGLTLSPDMRLFVHTIFRPEIYWVDIYR